MERRFWGRIGSFNDWSAQRSSAVYKKDQVRMSRQSTLFEEAIGDIDIDFDGGELEYQSTFV
jgi:hypothetical protein